MKFSISRKIIIISVVGVITSIIIILLLGSSLINRLFNNSLNTDMRAMQALVESMINEEEARLKQTIKILITLPAFVDAIYERDLEAIGSYARMMKHEFEYDLVTVTDERGIVLARGHSDKVLDDISDRQMIAEALLGYVSAGVYYEPTAEVPFSLRAFSPIYKDEVFIGVLSVGTDVASDEYVDRIHNITNIHFSIFYGDTRYATSFIDENGNRLVGTKKENQHILDSVLSKGEIAVDRSEILGEQNMVVMWPIIEADNGQIIGMWGIAMPLTEQISEMNRTMMLITLFSLGIMIIIALLAGWLGSKIARPIRNVTNYAMQVAAGNLDTPLDVYSKDEVGLLVGALQTMISTIKERISETEGLNKKVLKEVEETKRLMEEVERQRITADKANNAKSYFLRTISHEIRTPMNAVLGITEIQLMNEDLSPDIRADFERIYNAGYLLLGIINDILDLSKVEAGKLELAPDNYNVASLISDAAQLNVMRIGSKLLEFELNVDETIPATMFGDGLRIKQVLNNLLSNAFKYTDDGTVNMTVTINTENCTGDDVILIISVSDTGRGMTRDQIDCIFDDFSRFFTETGQTVEGTGLGMSITNNLIKLMSGEIFVESEQGKGSVFTVHIPQKRVDDDVLGKEMVDNLRLFRTSSKARIRRAQIVFEPMPYGNVLIVDDVDSNIYVAKGLMAPYELNIDSADRGLAAVDKIKNGNEYDVIFMDHMMPGMDGIETTKRIRDLGYMKPIIALTASAVAGQVDMFLSNGFDDYISKPIDIRQMNIVMNKYVRDKQTSEVLEEVRRSKENKTIPKNKKGGSHPMFEMETASKLAYKEVEGLDIARGLERYHNNEEAYIRVLSSYAIAVRDMLGHIETPDIEKINDYRIKVHGIKGACYDVFADHLAESAKALENAAIIKDFEFICAHNSQFRESALILLDNIDELLSVIDAADSEAGSRLTVDTISNDLLLKLITACEVYDMSGVDAVMDEIEMYEYETDKELSSWLRNKVDLINFTDIINRLGENKIGGESNA